MARLADEIKSKPFAEVCEEAMLNIIRTADVFSQRASEALKEFDLSPSQYNVLRILRGSPDGLCCGEIGERMISRDPDITRLLDRLDKRELVRRARGTHDRRVVIVRISPDGLALLAKADPKILAVNRQLLGHMGERKLRELIALLEEARP